MTTELRLPSTTPGSPRTGRRVLVGVIIGVVVVVSGVVVWGLMGANRSAVDGELSAWESRQQMNVVILDTAEHLGLSPSPMWVDLQPLSCVRQDGTVGLKYELASVEAESVADREGLLARTGEYWTGLGYEVGRRDIGPVVSMHAFTPDGGFLSLAAGEYGTRIIGYSACALRDGRAGSDS